MKLTGIPALGVGEKLMALVPRLVLVLVLAWADEKEGKLTYNMMASILPP